MFGNLDKKYGGEKGFGFKSGSRLNIRCEKVKVKGIIIH